MGLNSKLISYYPGKFRVFNWDGPKAPTKKERQDAFQRYARSVADNLAAYPGQVGFVQDFDGGLYEISRERRSARRLAENDPKHAEFKTQLEDSKL